MATAHTRLPATVTAHRLTWHQGSHLSAAGKSHTEPSGQGVRAAQQAGEGINQRGHASQSDQAVRQIR